MSQNLIHPTGILDAGTVADLLTRMPEDGTSILDFSDVPEIRFSALRTLMNARRAGRCFSIINASDQVVRRFVDSGVAAFIDVCRKPERLDMTKYEEFGASYMSKSYNSADGDAMIKVYGNNVPQEMVAHEKAVARAVMLFGLPTPLVGTLYADGGKTALDFERIPGKRSFSRIISEEPERTEEITRRFARMCRQLHATPCDTAIFEDKALAHREAVIRCKDLTDSEKAKILAFVDSIPAATTCIHGDLQMSNVIMTPEGEELWIDLGDFGYGHPMLDLAMWYFLTRLNNEERSQQLFHLGLEQLARIWDLFVEEYAEASSPEEKEAFEQEVRPYAALHMLLLGVNVGFVPGMLDQIKSILLPGSGPDRN
ncbi:MAG: phosphotransferase [Bacteroidales bacterium]|nr:phosphotransferase [Bacteroidales bacterium]